MAPIAARWASTRRVRYDLSFGGGHTFMDGKHVVPKLLAYDFLHDPT